MCYYQGHGIKQDYQQAEKWWRLAAKNGNNDAFWSLGALYYYGIGVSQDYREALSWFLKDLEDPLGYTSSFIGSIYERGSSGVAQNLSEAKRWYEIGAQKHSLESQARLGQLYIDGKGVPQDYKEGIKWVLPAAERGNSTAQYVMGRLYGAGLGISQDYVLAHMWFNLSASASTTSEEASTSVKARNTIQKFLSPSQIAEAQRLAREWKPKEK
jgi:TPR repeat protein